MITNIIKTVFWTIIRIPLAIIDMVITFPIINGLLKVTGIHWLLGTEARYTLEVRVRHPKMKNPSIKTFMPDGLLGKADKFFLDKKLKSGWTYYDKSDMKNAFQANCLISEHSKVFELPEDVNQGMKRSNYRGAAYNEKKVRKAATKK